MSPVIIEREPKTRHECESLFVNDPSRMLVGINPLLRARLLRNNILSSIKKQLHIENLQETSKYITIKHF